MTLMKESKMVYNAFKSEIAFLPVDDYLGKSKQWEQKKLEKKLFIYFSRIKKNQEIRRYQIIHH